MKNNYTNSSEYQNWEFPFTELFSLLKRYDDSSTGVPTLVYNSEELAVINQHIENAIDVLLRGLQEVGQLMGVTVEKKFSYRNKSAWFFYFCNHKLNRSIKYFTTGYMLCIK